MYNICMKADLHLHTNCSDGSDSPKELAQNVIKAGINIFALTDHDTVEGVREILDYIPENINFLPSVELTCKADSVKCHILGFNCNIEDDKLSSLINKGKKLRRQKLETRINYLREVWNIDLTKSELEWLYSRKSVVKTHLANILVNRGLGNNNVEVMKRYLDDCKTGNTRFTGEEAMAAITSANGTPVWAHPLGGEGEIHITHDEFYKKFEVMKSFGIQGLECYYSRYNQDEIEFLVDFANKNKLLISGGSDYHGSNKNISIGKLNVENLPVDSLKLTLLNALG